MDTKYADSNCNVSENACGGLNSVNLADRIVAFPLSCHGDGQRTKVYRFSHVKNTTPTCYRMLSYVTVGWTQVLHTLS